MKLRAAFGVVGERLAEHQPGDDPVGLDVVGVGDLLDHALLLELGGKRLVVGRRVDGVVDEGRGDVGEGEHDDLDVVALQAAAAEHQLQVVLEQAAGLLDGDLHTLEVLVAAPGLLLHEVGADDQARRRAPGNIAPVVGDHADRHAAGGGVEEGGRDGGRGDVDLAAAEQGDRVGGPRQVDHLGRQPQLGEVSLFDRQEGRRLRG